ncbi:hypothetical protein AAHC03_022505 [Spirometra sp. Aus1]
MELSCLTEDCSCEGTTYVPFCLLVAQLCIVWAGSYEGYLANLLARNEAAQEEFRRNNPSGQFVLDYLGSPEFRRFQPLLAESETDDTDADAWDAFLADLAYAADAAAKEDPAASAQHLSVAPWTKRPQLNDTPRNVELAGQNHLWGEHRMSGGSSEVGVKLDQLPAYCDPPNPCPLGYDPDSLPTPCDQNIPNTKEFNRAWIMRKMREGECPCDEEHMEVCPAAKPSFPSAAGFLKSVILHKPHKLDEVLDGENPYLRGRRRSSLVAKKFDRQKRFRARRHRLNSYLLGQHRNIVKKDGRRGSQQASFR